MTNKRLIYKRPRHRCPKCHSANIYKRFWVKRNSKKKGRSIRESYEKLKKYRCIVCKNEFDNALVE